MQISSFAIPSTPVYTGERTINCTTPTSNCINNTTADSHIHAPLYRTSVYRKHARSRGLHASCHPFWQHVSRVIFSGCTCGSCGGCGGRGGVGRHCTAWKISASACIFDLVVLRQKEFCTTISPIMQCAIRYDTRDKKTHTTHMSRVCAVDGHYTHTHTHAQCHCIANDGV